jgi:hypothetical protein
MLVIAAFFYVSQISSAFNSLMSALLQEYSSIKLAVPVDA